MSDFIVEINGLYYGIDGRWLGSSLSDCKVAGYLYSIGSQENQPIDLNFAQYSGKYYLQNGSLIKSNKKCGCLELTGSDKPGAITYYRNYLDIGEDIATSIATTEANPEEVCRDPEEEPGEGDLRCGGTTNILVTDINCSNYGSTIPCTSCNKRCDHCSDPYNPCPGCETWSSVGSEICYNTCKDCCPYPELGCVPRLQIFNSYLEVLSYFNSDTCAVGDNQKKACSESLENVNGTWQCYDLTTECGPGVEVNFSIEEYLYPISQPNGQPGGGFTYAVYDGIVLSSNGPINGFSMQTAGVTSVTAFVVPGGTARFVYENPVDNNCCPNNSCGCVKGQITARGVTVEGGHSCGSCGCSVPSQGPCEQGTYSVDVASLNIPILP